MAAPTVKKTAAETARLAVVTKRIAGGEALRVSASVPVLLGQPEPMEVRWINAGQITNRFFQVTERAGWMAVEPHEIAGGLPQGDAIAHDGRVVMGENGHLVLVKIPQREIDLIRRARADKLDRKMRSKTAFTGMVREDLARDGLERAAERMHDLNVDTLNVTRERVAIDPQPLDKGASEA